MSLSSAKMRKSLTGAEDISNLGFPDMNTLKRHNKCFECSIWQVGLRLSSFKFHKMVLMSRVWLHRKTDDLPQSTLWLLGTQKTSIYHNHSMPLNKRSVGIKDAESSFWPLHLSFLSSLTCGREMLRVIMCPVGKAKSGPDCLLSFKQ